MSCMMYLCSEQLHLVLLWQQFLNRVSIESIDNSISTKQQRQEMILMKYGSKICAALMKE